MLEQVSPKIAFFYQTSHRDRKRQRTSSQKRCRENYSHRGAVESAVKQIGKRLKISGAQWKLENVPRMLQLRCAYLNGQLTA
jgi:hypothetical protein